MDYFKMYKSAWDFHKNIQMLEKMIVIGNG